MRSGSGSSRLAARYFPAAAILTAVGLTASGTLRQFILRPLWSWIFLAGIAVACAVAGKMRLSEREARNRRGEPLHSDEMLFALAASGAFVLAVPLNWLSFAVLCGASVTAGLMFGGWALLRVASLLAVLSLADGFHGLGEQADGGAALWLLKTVLVALFALIPTAVLRLTGRTSQLPGPACAPAETDALSKAGMEEIEEKAAACRLLEVKELAGKKDSLSSFDLEKWLQDAVAQVDGAVGASLQMAQDVLGTHACAVFLLSMDGKTFFLHDFRGASGGELRTSPIPSGEGVLGAAMEKKAAIRLSSQSLGIASYYEGKTPPLSGVIAVPVFAPDDEGTVRGVLVADRMEDLRPFSEGDERLLRLTGVEIMRAIERERLLTWFKRAHDEKERLYVSIARLNRTFKTIDALNAAMEEASALAELSFAALTLVQEDQDGRRSHQVMCATEPDLENLVFQDNSGLVANVVRYGRPLPERDVGRMESAVIFDEPMDAGRFGALRIFPLTAGEKIIGTLVAGRGPEEPGFEEETLRALEVLSMQAAQSVQRADLFDRMERMATTDGLTGLVNHRTFQGRCDEVIQLAKRYGKKMSLMLTDIDHFKRVNDTYGHPTGDQVLRGVARILREASRDTDIAARYGGEEFCLVMPETDAAGAKVIAERIRKRIEAHVFETEQGPLKVTMSLGIATYPDSAVRKQDLIDLSDQCLYFAKEHGRNQSVTVEEMQAGAGRPKVES